MNKHTPGPFKVVPPTQWTKEWSVMSYNFTVCSGIDREENAQRIVDCLNACEGINPKAVPELLDKLKEILAVDSHKGGGYSDLFYDDPEFRKELEALVAKAEGRGK